MIKDSRKISYWGLAFLGVFTFLSLLILMIVIIGTKESNNSSTTIIHTILNSIAISTPFTIVTGWINYKMVLFLNKNKWMQQHFTLRILFEILFILVIAIFIVVAVNSLFWLNNDILNLISHLFKSGSIISSILINTFIVVIIEYIVQSNINQQLKQENALFHYQQLKNQINPHFLFNSLNALVSLINSDPKSATLYTKKLSDIYRYVLLHDLDNLATLRNELAFINNYIEVLQIRYGNTLKVNYKLLDNDLECSIPPLSLQLLVENAVKHNSLSNNNPLTITISTDGEYITVTNNLQPRTSVREGMNIGLKNLNSKYAIISDKQIIINKTENNFTIKLPLI